MKYKLNKKFIGKQTSLGLLPTELSGKMIAQYKLKLGDNFKSFYRIIKKDKMIKEY